jgi:exosortase
MTTTIGRTLIFVLYALALMLANTGVLRQLVDLSMNDRTASHAVLVPFVSLALIVMRRESIFSATRTAWVAAIGCGAVGVAAMWLGVALRAAGRDADALSASVVGLVVLLIGGFLMCYGRTAFRAALFPLLFLIFMIPVPTVLLDASVAFLKRGSAEAVSGLLTLTGTPFHRDQFVFSMPNVAIVIADECSGIRSSIGLLLTSLLVGDMFLQTGWKKALFVAAMVPLAIVKNAIRIVSLVQLAVRVDPGFLTGQLHHEGGIVFYLLTLLIAAPLFLALQRSERPLLEVNN